MAHASGNLHDRIVVVTGAAGGIGSAIVRACLDEGAIVVATDHDENGEQKSTDGLAALPDERLFRCDIDLRDRAQIRGLADKVQGRWGRLDGLVNCAAVRFAGPVADHSDDIWDNTLAINLTAAFLLVRETESLLKQSDHASVVNIGSVVGTLARTNAVAYCTAKSGMHGLTRALAADLGPSNIRVNCLIPSFAETPMTAARLQDPAKVAHLVASHALDRWAQTSEVAAGVVFLLSDQASFITGVELPVDGGWLATKAV